jgi:hypothetical protein
LKTINLKVDDDLHKALKLRAVEEQTDMTKLLIKISSAYVAQKIKKYAITGWGVSEIKEGEK